MPRNLDPAALSVTGGRVSPDLSAPNPGLTGPGLPGPGPNVGVRSEPPLDQGENAHPGLVAHVQMAQLAHGAAEIEVESPSFSGVTLSEALEELRGAVEAAPPQLGQVSPSTAWSGVPDWGTLKLRDQSLTYFGDLSDLPNGTTAEEIYPYFLTTAGVASDRRFPEPGGDPRTDHLWNDGCEGLGEPGSGWGRAHVGAYTRDGAGPAPQPVIRSTMLLDRGSLVDPETGAPYRIPVTISGSLFPADRGVLALFHFPPQSSGDLQAEFLAQPLVTDWSIPQQPTGRVVAATLLGTGVLGDKHLPWPCETPTSGDGDPGGIFSLGWGVDGYQPFAFPGRASGQYDLSEIHAGVDREGNPLRAPFDDFDGDGNPGASRADDAVVPAPGQVRLGTDPEAGEAPLFNGIPILGGTAAAFLLPPIPELGSLGEPLHGDSLVRDSNFLRYRLPVLADYSVTSGLKWTPRGEDPLVSMETSRFFEIASPHALTWPDGTAVPANLTQAGNYSGFGSDYWTWQIARYRHTFLMPSRAAAGDREEVGSYLLVHFKRERDFETFAREGVFPWSASGYSVYGASIVDTTHVESSGNIANEWSTAPQSPRGPAPTYGLSSPSESILRTRILLDAQGLVDPTVVTSEYSWSSVATPLVEGVTLISGVAYFTPRRVDTGAVSFQVQNVELEVDPGFWTTYCTDPATLTSGTAPAQIASSAPVLLGTAPFGYENSPVFSYGAPGLGHLPSAAYVKQHRAELPYTYLGSNGSGVFDETNGPLESDSVSYSSGAVSDIPLVGDGNNPSFSSDAAFMWFLRRPLLRTDPDTEIVPMSLTDGQGVKAAASTPVLLHTTVFDKTGLGGEYGNFVVNALGGVLPNVSYPALFTSRKDLAERFLDETYRLVPGLSFTFAGHGPYTADAESNLQGPGVGDWLAPIEIPTRIGLSLAPWNEASWILNEWHVAPLNGSLQVAGLPHRNPLLAEGVQVPFPSTGLLKYPTTDYTGHSPESNVHFDGVQPDYSGHMVSASYLRVLDVARAHGTPIPMVGQSLCLLRVDGVTVADLLYKTPGPGGLLEGRPALMLKVPGLTTWMDAGRVDGSGPSKQDPSRDGAGCLILGEDTYTFTDPVTGYPGCYLLVHVGPHARFFANTGAFSSYTSGSPEGECPLLVRVDMESTASSYCLEYPYLGGGAWGPVSPGASPREVRGILSISVVSPEETRISPDPVQVWSV